jgi:hypothetical protein
VEPIDGGGKSVFFQILDSLVRQLTAIKAAYDIEQVQVHHSHERE